LALAKICGGELIETLTSVVKYVRDLIQKIPDVNVKKALNTISSLLNEILSDIDSINTAINISKQLK
jgi:hypothetical protein